MSHSGHHTPASSPVPTSTSVDEWVPGGEGAAYTCSASLSKLLDPSHPRYNAAFAPWIQSFANSSGVHLASQAPTQAGLAGGCAALAYPELAYTWHRQLRPMLKAQLDRLHGGKPPLPLGSFGQPAAKTVATCAIQDNTLSHCTATTGVPLYETLGCTQTFRYPTDVPVVDPVTGCVAYDLPRVGPSWAGRP